jgi:uncharacterized protein DUF4242
MPIYLVEGSYPEGVALPRADAAGVHWLSRYLTEDGTHLFVLCDAPHPEAVRLAAGQQGVPIDRIYKVQTKEGSR